MARYLRLILISMKYQYKGTMTHRGAFIINCTSQGLDYAAGFVTMWIMINAFSAMGQWNQYEVMLLYAMSLASYGIAGTFFFSMTINFHRIVRDGTFDDALVKPVGVLAYLTSGHIILNYIPHLLLSLMVMALCFVKLPISPGPLSIMYFALSVVCGGMIYASLFLLVCIVTIITVKAQSLQSVIFSMRELSYYPLSIFPPALQIVMVCVVPYGLINFFPVQVLLGKQDYLMFGPAVQYLSPLIAAAMFALALFGFSYTLRFYKSSGS